MRLAHLTDLHLPIPTPPRLSELVGKRAFGYLSWTRNRQFRHRIEALEKLVADCRRLQPEFTVISGDLVNISTDAEFIAASQWLKDNFDAAATTFSPGNHDAYVRRDWAHGLGLFSDFMVGARAGAAAPRAPVNAADFPFVRQTGPVSLIVANSAPPKPIGLATGTLGAAQIDRIGAELDAARSAGRCRILVLHHPATAGATPARKALTDAPALRAMLAQKGVELVLHGHTHYPVWERVSTPDGDRPVVGGGSASHPSAAGKYNAARYNIFDIDGDFERGWRIGVEVRELDGAGGGVETVERRALLGASNAEN